MNTFYKIKFVFSSFAPLYAIVALKLWLACAPDYAVVGFLSLLVLALLVAANLICVMRNQPFTEHNVKDIKSSDTEIFPYIMSYIPMFIRTDILDKEFLYPVIILYGLILILYVKLENVYLHPILAIGGFRIYQGRTKDSANPIVIISKGRRLSGEESDLKLHEIGTSTIYYCDDG